MKGYAGIVLRVNLSDKSFRKEPLNEEFARQYIGGSGLGIRMAYDEVSPAADPLGPEAKLYFMTGPVTGTILGTSGRYQAVFKSPLTGLLCDSSSSGYWGAELKKCGYDGLVVEGISPSPVFLLIREGKVEIKDAAGCWGMDTMEVQDFLRREAGDDAARVACIGRAGEQKVPYAAIMNDECRAAARGGGGAVMGSKRLKAIVVRGSKKPDLFDEALFKKVAQDINKKNARDLEGLGRLGTISVHDDRWPISDIPVKNWSMPSTEEICVSLGGNKLLEIMPHRTNSCHACPIRCARWVKIEDGPYAFEGAGPEYESSAALGSLCMVTDIKAMSYLNHLCNLYGLDTISTGATIAFAMECFEKGYLARDQLDGKELRWGDAETMIELVKEIAFAEEGAGQLLGLGTRKLAERVGRESMDFAVQVKGLELPMHDPRTRFSWASTYATASRGGCHLKGMSDTWEDANDPLPEWNFTGSHPSQSDDRKAEMTMYAQIWGHLRDSLVMCHFATVVHQPSIFSDLLNAATGSELAPRDLLVIGERISNLHRMYNIRCGLTGADDTLPKRVLTPLKGGGADGKVPDLKRQLKELYALKGWDDNGIPTRKTLESLNLDFTADALNK